MSDFVHSSTNLPTHNVLGYHDLDRYARFVHPTLRAVIHTTPHLLLTPLRQLLPMALVLVLLPGCAGDSPSRPSGSVPPVRTAEFSVNDPAELPKSLTIKLHNHRGYLFAPTRINGKRAGMFMFDTGSSLAVVSTGVAGRLDLPTNGSGQATGVGGQQAYKYRAFESLEFGGLEVKGQRAAAISFHGMSRGIGMSVSGLIGIKQFDDLPFTLDYSDDTLTVYRRDSFTPPPGVKPFAGQFNIGGLPAIGAELGQGRKVWLILDSGADNELTLPRSCLTLWPDLVTTPGTGSGHSAGVGGTVASTYTWLDTLEVFGLTLKDMPVQFEQAPEVFNRQPRPIGRVGGAFLKNFRLTMDPQRRLIWAQWLPGEE